MEKLVFENKWGFGWYFIRIIMEELSKYSLLTSFYPWFGGEITFNSFNFINFCVKLNKSFNGVSNKQQ